jgi:hypothetical protein
MWELNFGTFHGKYRGYVMGYEFLIDISNISTIQKL